MKGTFIQTPGFYMIFLVYVFLIPIKANGTPPTQPQLVSPLNNSNNTLLNPTLRWVPLSGATSYRVQIFKIKDGGDGIVFRTKSIKEKCMVPGGYLSGSTAYKWQVKAINAIGSGEWSAAWQFKTQPFCLKNDQDCDGIPDQIEKDLFKTDIRKKTLFIRPKKKTELGKELYEYWEDFYVKLFPGSHNGRANIPAFTEAGIELVVVGASDNPCEIIRGARGFSYKPEDHPDWPCDILEITLINKWGVNRRPIFCVTSEDSKYKGHTYFRSDCPVDPTTTKSFWSWSIFGYASSAEKSYKYYKSFIYAYPLDRYFKEGAYEKIAVGEKPVVTDCKKYPTKCNGLSPFNLNDNDPPPNPPYTMKPDETVEFNEIEFDSEGRITKIGKRGKPYTKYQVLARTTVHEIGHSLLDAVMEDHCQNPCCIMYRYTLDRDQKLFGPPCNSTGNGSGILKCQHSHGGSKDIRAIGIVYNYTH